MGRFKSLFAGPTQFHVVPEKNKRNSQCFKQLTDEILKVDELYSSILSADLLKKRISLKIVFDILSTQQAECHIQDKN